MSLDVTLSLPSCPRCGRAPAEFSQNITHNLTKMADEAGILGVVWYPETNGITTAQQLIAPLRKAIAAMKADPKRFKKHNSPNGWGLYKHFLPWLEEYLRACEEMPNASVHVSR